VDRVRAIALTRSFVGRGEIDHQLDVVRPQRETALHGGDIRRRDPLAVVGRRRRTRQRRESADDEQKEHEQRGTRGAPHRSPRYQSSRLDPTVAESAAPSARNVPNGSAYFNPPRRLMMSASPTSVPLNDAIISVTSVSFHPRNAPTIASIFTSPIPSPSSPRMR